MIMQEKIKVMKKNKFRIRRIRFYSAKVPSIQKSPQITHRTHGDSSQSPYPYHTHTHGNPHGNPHTHGSPAYRCRIRSFLCAYVGVGSQDWSNTEEINVVRRAAKSSNGAMLVASNARTQRGGADRYCLSVCSVSSSSSSSRSLALTD